MLLKQAQNIEYKLTTRIFPGTLSYVFNKNNDNKPGKNIVLEMYFTTRVFKGKVLSTGSFVTFKDRSSIIGGKNLIG